MELINIYKNLPKPIPSMGIDAYIEEKNKFYISEKGDLIKYIEVDYYNNLPLLFLPNQ